MTTVADDRLLDQLAPLRRALLDDASVEADRLIEAARADADHLAHAAQTEVDDAVRRARDKATAAAGARAEASVVSAHRRAHTALLTAKSELRRAVADRVHDAVGSLPDDPRFPQLLDHLERLARSQLGVDAVIERGPDGGFVATAGSRRVDYRLTAIADRAIEAAPEEVARSWS